MYDYILFGGVFFLFLLFIVVSILTRKKVFLALFFIVMAFSTLILGPTLGYIAMHKYLFKNSVVLESQKRLTFTKAVVVKGSITNESEFDFTSCKVRANLYKISTNKYKNYLFSLKPLKKASMLTPAIPKGSTHQFKLFIEPFTYSKEYNITLGADCK